jgi:hypothetical protein
MSAPAAILLGAGAADDGRQDNEDIFIGQMIGYPDFDEGVL